MLKSLMLLGATMIAVPALAQNKPATGNDAAGRVPVATTPASPTAQPVTDAVQPVDPAVAQQAPQTSTPAMPGPDIAAQPAPTAQPASSGDQVASVVDSEFPTYDKDGDGKLSKPEFGAWMVALKTKSDPAAKANAPATKTWVAGAFKQADTDKNAAVSKVELTSFLSQGKSQG